MTGFGQHGPSWLQADDKRALGKRAGERKPVTSSAPELRDRIRGAEEITQTALQPGEIVGGVPTIVRPRDLFVIDRLHVANPWWWGV